MARRNSASCDCVYEPGSIELYDVAGSALNGPHRFQIGEGPTNDFFHRAGGDGNLNLRHHPKRRESISESQRGCRIRSNAMATRAVAEGNCAAKRSITRECWRRHSEADVATGGRERVIVRSPYNARATLHPVA